MTLATGKTLTAPTINASSNLQVGGANLNTIYAPISGSLVYAPKDSPNFTSTIQSSGNIVVVGASYGITSPTVNATSPLQKGGVKVNTAPYASGRVYATGGIASRFNGQQQAWTCTKNSTGNYTITFTACHPSGLYGVLCTCNQGYYASYTGIINTYFTIGTYNSSGTATDADFTCQTIPWMHLISSSFNWYQTPNQRH